MMKMSPRLDRLGKRAIRRQRCGGKTFIYERNDQIAYAEIARRIYEESHEAEVLRKAAFLESFAGKMPVRIHQDELIVGDQTFSFVHRIPELRQYLGEVTFPRNKGHIAVDYARVVQLGIDRLKGEVEAMPDNDGDSRNRQAFLRTLEAFSLFIHRHAKEAERLAITCDHPFQRRELKSISEVCKHLVHSGAETFHQALQMVWFIQIFLHAEASAAAVSFGRFDLLMQPYLESDLQKDTSFHEERAVELVGAFFIKCCEGDESQNLTLGGLDMDGCPADNRMTEICLMTMKSLRSFQPSLSLRVHPQMSDAVWKAALELLVEGMGQPSFFNDTVVINGLIHLGMPPDRARDWSVVGCYEAAPDGDSYPLTTLGGWSLPASLVKLLKETEETQALDYSSFEELLQRHLQREWTQRILPMLQKKWNRLRDECPSPFESICVNGCIASGQTTQEGGARFNLAGVNILGIGTFIDSLYGIKKLVYGLQEMNLQQMKSSLASDLNDPVIRCRLRMLPGKFGSDSPETNQLVRKWTTYIALMVLGSKMEQGVRPYPGFFWFLRDIMDPGLRGDLKKVTPATPDGRRGGDSLSYGAGPSTLATGITPTTVLNSVANIPHELAVNGNPLLLSLNHKDVAGEVGRQRLRHLIEGYFSQGGFHLHFNIIDAKQLRDAQQIPEEYVGVIVRISGFSARFINLDKSIQDAIIERTEQGL